MSSKRFRGQSQSWSQLWKQKLRSSCGLDTTSEAASCLTAGLVGRTNPVCGQLAVTTKFAILVIFYSLPSRWDHWSSSVSSCTWAIIGKLLVRWQKLRRSANKATYIPFERFKTHGIPTIGTTNRLINLFTYTILVKPKAVVCQPQTTTPLLQVVKDIQIATTRNVSCITNGNLCVLYTGAQ